MKKTIIITAISLITAIFTTTAYAFPQPDWGALLSERRSMVTAQEFELYVEGDTANALYYGAKNEPAAGAYIGAIPENSGELAPLSSYLTYFSYDSRESRSYIENDIKGNDVAVMVGFNTNTIYNIDYDYIRRTLEYLNNLNKPVFVRFANEMNVSSLGDDPSAYISAFRNVANMIHEYDNLAVVWSPNDMGALDRPFKYYYPGDEYVDWVGVSCYMTKYFLNNTSTTEKDSIYFMTGPYAWATNKIKPIMEFMKNNNIQKPVMISEGGVERYDKRGEDFSGWHEPRLRNMLWYLVMKYPQIKMVNYFNTDNDYEDIKYRIAGYPYSYESSVEIFNAAANSGAYKRSASQDADFVFSKANDGETLIAENGYVNLYTLAYFANNPDISVNYKIDGVWFHSSNSIPYICHFDINSITDGAHTLTIEANGASKSYTLYKNGQYMAFGHEPDTSKQPRKAVSDTVAEKKISVFVNGNEIEFDQPPVIIDERTLVPMRAIFEALGADVEWDNNIKKATATRGDTTIDITIEDNKIYKKVTGKRDEVIELDVIARLINDRTMVPVRAVSEAFGSNVDWDGENRAVVIWD